MPDNRWIGHRGENLFRFAISKPCTGRMWFTEKALGESHPALDFEVGLEDLNIAEMAHFYVQVKATIRKYSGKGSKRKLNVNVSKKDIRKLKNNPGPTYVVGVDVIDEKVYIVPILKGGPSKIRGLPIRRELDCATIRLLWDEVRDYWKENRRPLKKSALK